MLENVFKHKYKRGRGRGFRLTTRREEEWLTNLIMYSMVVSMPQSKTIVRQYTHTHTHIITVVVVTCGFVSVGICWSHFIFYFARLIWILIRLLHNSVKFLFLFSSPTPFFIICCWWRCLFYQKKTTTTKDNTDFHGVPLIFTRLIK